ncbi:MAG: type 4a pilus biogenesis protein PilO [Candidatus Omnitrophica bacterium]|nr:type 4a pilus biogenesis protein PilO [Candidatus Omnitrophota bacterium]
MKKSLIVNLIVVVILVMAGVWVYNYQAKVLQGLNQQKEEETRKNAIIEQIGRSEKKMFAYKRLLYRKEISALVSLINKLAAANKIKISSISPMPEDIRDYYIKQGIRLEISAKSYHDVANFVSALEKAPEIFVVETASMVAAAATEKDSSGIKANLVVRTYIYKE